MRKTSIIIILCAMVLGACNNTPKLENTPLALNDINEIGELITSEYYGEVIKSLTSLSKSEVYFELEQDFIALAQVCKLHEKKARNENKLMRALRNAGIFKEHRFKRLRKLSSFGERDFTLEILLKKEWDEFLLSFENDIEDYIEKREIDNKGEIVYLGRGWVKAGFDLTQIDFQNNVSFSFDTMTIRNLDPILLDSDINPWLVPGVITGYEIVKMNKRVSLEEIQEVKAACKEGLRQEAISAGIYEHALASGRQSLEGLFGLMNLPGKGVINTVVIEPSKYFEYKREFLQDRSIDSVEFGTIQEIIQQDTSFCDSVWFNTLAEQKQFLERFVEEIHDESMGSNNHPAWPVYFDSLQIKN